MSAKAHLLHGHICCVLCASAPRGGVWTAGEALMQGTLSSRQRSDQSTVIQTPQAVCSKVTWYSTRAECGGVLL